MFVWACNYNKTCLWAQLLICEGIFEHSSSFSSFSSIFFLYFKCDKWINILIHVQASRYKKKHVSEHSYLSGWVILSVLAYLAHLAKSYFSLIFSAIYTYNCAWFDLTNKKHLQRGTTKAWWKLTNAYNFYPQGDNRHYW